jgi:hypothetical protein
MNNSVTRINSAVVVYSVRNGGCYMYMYKYLGVKHECLKRFEADGDHLSKIGSDIKCWTRNFELRLDPIFTVFNL